MGSAILRASVAAFALMCVTYGGLVWYRERMMIEAQNPRLVAPVGGSSVRHANNHNNNHGGVQGQGQGQPPRGSGSLAATAMMETTSGGSEAKNRTGTSDISPYYRPPAFAAPNNATTKGGKRKPPPIRALEQYIKWHSVDALQQNPDNRTFAVVFYSCPLQAGNRIHHYLSGLYWSIVTNRTMLVQYWDTETCTRYGSLYSPAICQEANSLRDCDEILARAPWIPLYDDWHPLLKLPSDDPTELPFYATHPTYVTNPRYPWGPGNDDNVRGIDDNVKYGASVPLVIFPQIRFKITYMDPQTPRNSAHELLHTQQGRQTNALLHNLGPDFLFGMLQRYSFEITDAVKRSAAIPPIEGALPEQEQEQEPDPGGGKGGTYTIALHSRHIDPALDGCDISRERKCVNQLLNNNNNNNAAAALRRTKKKKPATLAAAAQSNNATTPTIPPCAVAIMSDRACTLSALSEWLHHRGCEVHVARHETRDDYLSEHGPFAGAGFFQDLALATTVARSAFIGMKRSSSDVVLELLQFYQTMEAWEQSNVTNPDVRRTTRVDVCLLSKIAPPPKPTKTTTAGANRTHASP